MKNSYLNCPLQISSLSLFVLNFLSFPSMKMLYSNLPVKLQNVEILSKDEKALWGK